MRRKCHILNFFGNAEVILHVVAAPPLHIELDTEEFRQFQDCDLPIQRTSSAARHVTQDVMPVNLNRIHQCRVLSLKTIAAPLTIGGSWISYDKSCYQQQSSMRQ